MPNKKKASFACLCLLVFFLLTGPAYCRDQNPANAGLGLFSLGSNAYFQNFRFSMPLTSPEQTEKGHWETGFYGSAANNWSYEENEHLIDCETYQGAVWLAYGLSRRTGLRVAYREHWISGGFLDHSVEAFHNASGIGQNQRDRFPAGQAKVRIKWDPSGPLLYARNEKGVLYRGVNARLTHYFTKGNEFFPAFSLGLTAGLDLRDPSLTDRRFPLDLGLEMAFSKKIWGLYAYVTPAVVWYGADQVQGVHFKAWQFSGMAGLEWPFHPDVSACFSWIATEKAAGNTPGFPRLSHEVALGVKARVFTQGTLELAILENVLTYSNSPDFGLHLGFSWLFPGD